MKLRADLRAGGADFRALFECWAGAEQLEGAGEWAMRRGTGAHAALTFTTEDGKLHHPHHVRSLPESFSTLQPWRDKYEKLLDNMAHFAFDAAATAKYESEDRSLDLSGEQWAELGADQLLWLANQFRTPTTVTLHPGIQLHHTEFKELLQIWGSLEKLQGADGWMAEYIKSSEFSCALRLIDLGYKLHDTIDRLTSEERSWVNPPCNVSFIP